MSHPKTEPTKGYVAQVVNSRDDPMGREQRLENMGLFATRVAHDLNNMLSPMKIAIPMLRPAITDTAARSLLDSLETTVERATALVRQILDYAHGEGGQLELVLVRRLVEEIGLFAKESFPSNIQIEIWLQQDLWLANANLSQIHQVLLNLCVNARDAMPQGGTLSLRAENCTVSAPEAAAIEGGRAGSFLVLQVDDTGTGFSPEVLPMVWEPFFTTKHPDKSSGLGLSTIREIIHHHGGFIQLATAVDKGSTFRIYLPAVIASGEKPIDASLQPV